MTKEGRWKLTKTQFAANMWIGGLICVFLVPLTCFVLSCLFEDNFSFETFFGNGKTFASFLVNVVLGVVFLMEVYEVLSLYAKLRSLSEEF